MNFSWGHLPIDIIILALVAFFLAWRLRTVLGKSIGFDSMQISALQKKKKPVNSAVSAGPPQPVAKTEKIIPPMESAAGQVMLEIAQRDKGFTPAGFLDGAEIAFRRILGFYAKNDARNLQQNLTEEAFSVFNAAIIEREKNGEILTTEIKAIPRIAIEQAQLDTSAIDPVARIDVRFVSDQMNYTKDKNGHVIAGMESVTEFVDVWTFERILGQTPSAKDAPSWRLSAARSG